MTVSSPSDGDDGRQAPDHDVDPQSSIGSRGQGNRAGSAFFGQTPPPSLALPKGGGAIRPSANDFAVDVATGAGSLEIPIPVFAGRANHEPQLALAYGSGSGNGLFGLGFGVSVPRLWRQTDRRIPRYIDEGDGELNVDADIFELTGNGELVPLLRADGSPEEQARTAAGQQYTIRRYRARTETGFSRIERWRRSDGDVHWRVTNSLNEVSVFGPDSSTRISDPEEPNRIFAWLLARTVEDRGDMIAYDYLSEDLRGCAGAASEAGHTNSTELHLKAVHYGFAKPVSADTPGGAGQAAYHVVFDYGDHDPAAPQAAPDRDWALRPDPYSSFRSGFDLRVRRLCRRVLMFNDFAALGPKPVLVRSLDLAYVADDPLHAADGKFLSLLASVQLSGHISTAAGSVTKSHPEVRLDWSPAEIDTAIRTLVEDVRHPGLENLPAGVDGTEAQWLDMDGDAAPGVLVSTGRAWRYRAPDPLYEDDPGSGAQAALLPLKLLSPVPASAATAESKLADIDGTGLPLLVDESPPETGVYTRDRRGRWNGYRPMRAQARDRAAGDTRYTDLDGDGLADLLVLEGTTLKWRPSLGKDGFGPLTKIVLDGDERHSPRQVTGDAREAIFLADITGDGLSDICRVRNRSILYFPNKGGGRFAPGILLDSGVPFDDDWRFDPRRLRFADVDGTGPTDIFYLHADGARLYRNQSGNGLAAPIQLPPIPGLTTPETVSVVDLLGSGTTCLVFSSPLPRNRFQPLRYMDLMRSRKPHLLTGVDNGLGFVRKVAYAPSTKFAMADRAKGRPWLTRLPFPVHVVEKVELLDHVSRTKLVTRYRYHHGWFDPDDREFRGFARVDQEDSESLSAFLGVGMHTETPLVEDGSFHLPIVRTIAWFHLGDGVEPRRIADELRQEYWNGDSLAAGAAPPAIPTARPQDWRDLWRALKGRPIRTELFADDGAAQASIPYLVTEKGYEVRLLQAGEGRRRSIVEPIEIETLEYRYERFPDDPRITHQLALELDEFGYPREAVSINYARRPNPNRIAGQDNDSLLLTSTSWIHRDDQPDWFRLGMPAERSNHELTGFARAGSQFTKAELAAAPLAAAIAFEGQPTAGTKQRRLLSVDRVLYRRDDLGGPLPFGQIERLAVPWESYRLAATDALLTTLYGGRATAALMSEGGHVHFEGDADWWIPSGTVRYSPGAGDSAATERAFAAANFFLPVRFIDPFGAAHVVTYDLGRLFIVSSTSPLGLKTSVTVNHRTGAEQQIVDPNGVASAVRFNPLGLVEAVFTFDPATGEGDSFDTASEETSVADDPSTRFGYELDRWRTLGRPARTSVRRRDRRDPGASWFETFLYFDGRGRELQRKAIARPGLAPVRAADGALQTDPSGAIVEAFADPRWAATGSTVYDNKGNIIRLYTSFFDSTEEFTNEPELVRSGVGPLLRYDPVGRLVRTDFPDGSVARAELNSWSSRSWDQNDCTLQSDWWISRGAPSPSASEPADAQTRAAWLAARHDDTPASDHFDVLGRAILTLQDLGPLASPRFLETRLRYDISGNLLDVTDPAGRRAELSTYDMARRRSLRGGIDDGFRFDLHDIAGTSMRRWISGATSPASLAPAHDVSVSRTEFDPLRRPTHMWLDMGAGNKLIGRLIYGEAHPNSSRRLKGRLWRTYDSGGLSEVSKVSLDGLHSEESLRLVKDPTVLVVDWSALSGLTAPGALNTASAPLLRPETWVRRKRFDVLGRLIQLVTPHGSGLKPRVIQPLYDLGGHMSGCALWHSLAASPSGMLDPATADEQPARDIEYDAQGDRVRALWHHGNETRYSYDPLTKRLTELRTGKFDAAGDPIGELLQHRLHYHDVVGNLVETRDLQAQVGAIFFNNRKVDPVGRFAYDPLYRLVSARGREQVSMSGSTRGPPIRTSDNDSGRFGVHPNDGQAMEAYSEAYSYDVAGNLLSMRHQTAKGAWRRDYDYRAGSCLEAGNSGNRLSSVSGPGELPPGPFVDSFGHDAFGQMTSMPHLSVMVWDAQGELRETRRRIVAGGTAEASFYSCTAGGYRTQKATFAAASGGGHGRKLSERLYLGEVEIYREFNRDGSIRIEREAVHVDDGKDRLLLVETKTVSGQGDTDPGPAGSRVSCYQHGDHTGSVSLELNDAGKVISFEEYFPFGGTSVQTRNASVRAAAKRYRFAARERDEETGLYRYGSRYYAPWLGRWVSSDPVFKPIRTNGYAFVRNNPLTFFDASGSDEEPSNWNRFTGGLRTLGGAAQAAVGALVFVQVEVPVAAQAVGGFAMYHGADDMQAGFHQMISGRHEKNVTQIVTEKAVSVFTDDKQTQERIATGVDIAAGFVSPTPGANLPGATARVPMIGMAQLSNGEKVLVATTKEITIPAQLVLDHAKAAQLTSRLVTGGDAAVSMMQNGNDDGSSSSSSSSPSSSGNGEVSTVGGGQGAPPPNSSTVNSSSVSGATNAVSHSSQATSSAGNASSNAWKLNPFARGDALEKLAAAGRSELALPRTFKTIDRTIVSAVGNTVERITSVKSMDMTAKSYAGASGAVMSRLNAYVDRLAGFTTYTLQGITVTAGPKTERVLEIITEGGKATQAQLAEIAAAEARAATKGIRFEVRNIP